MALMPEQRRRLLRMNMLMAYASFASSKAVAWTPATLFANAEVGGWYDPSDLTTMFQDAAGTTAAALESPVGLVLDKSKGLVLGSELVTNGDFSNGSTGWTLGANWSVTGGEAVGVPTPGLLSQTISITAGNTYKVSFSARSVTSLRVRLGGTTNQVNSSLADGSYTYYLVAESANSLIGFTCSTGGSAIIDNISVRELPGSHLSQSTSTARPVLMATSRIDYDGTDDKMTAVSSGGGTTGFLFVAGVNLDVIGANQTIWSDTGTNTGYRVRINSSNQLELAAGNGTSYTTAVTTETLSATANYVIAAWHDGTNLNVKLGAGGAVASQGFATASAGSAGFTMGMDNGAVSAQLNGKIYNAVYVKNFSGTLANVNSTISYVNGKMA